MWDLVGNPEDWFSHNEAHIVPVTCAHTLFIGVLDSGCGQVILHEPAEEIRCVFDDI